MRFLPHALILFTAGFSSLRAAEPSPVNRQQVIEAEKQWVKAVLSPDRSTLDNLLLPDLVYAHSTGKVETKQQFVDAVISGSTKYISIDFTSTNVRQYGDTVIVNHEAVFKTEPNGSTNLFLTMVWVREGQSWKLASRHASRLP